MKLGALLIERLMDPIKIIAQLYSVRTDRDGGGKIVLEFGQDSLEGVIELQKLNSKGDTSLAVVIVSYNELDKEQNLPTS